MFRLPHTAALFVLFAALALPGSAPGAESQPSTAVDSTERLARAVENLGILLERQIETLAGEKELRELDIAISYLNFRSRRIELMEQDLNRIRNERGHLEDLLINNEERRDMLLKALDSAPTDQRKAAEQTLQELLLRKKTFEQRLARTEEDIIVQENRITDLQNQLDAVENYVQQHLKL